ncbi:MAG TPA: DinB family protein [Terriglobales bacterium]
MIDHLRRMFSYNNWANQQVLSALEALGSPPAQALKLLAHIVAAERLWLERLQSQPQTFPVWPEFSLPECKRETDRLHQLWPRYLSTLAEPGLAAEIDYKNTRGENWSNTRGDILEHVIIHSAHHRGQIVALIRATGNVPPTLDFIHAVRQGFVK